MAANREELRASAELLVIFWTCIPHSKWIFACFTCHEEPFRIGNTQKYALKRLNRMPPKWCQLTHLGTMLPLHMVLQTSCQLQALFSAKLSSPSLQSLRCCLKGLWDEFCVLRRALFPMQRRSRSQWIYDEEPESLTVNASS